MATAENSSTVYIGNLKNSVRILELKTSLHKLFSKTLKLQVTVNDISIVNGTKRYAIVDVHNEQNVDFVLQNLADYEDRKHLKFDFSALVEDGTWLYVDTVKSQDDKQARDNFENAKNPPLRPYQKPHLHVRKRPDYGRAVAIKTRSSVTPSQTGRFSRQTLNAGRISRQTQNSQSDVYTSTDLDVTLDDYPVDRDQSPVEKVSNRAIRMVRLDVSNNIHDDSDDSGTQMDSANNRTLSSIHGDGDDVDNSPPVSDYEDPPGSVIDLRHINRGAFTTKITPRIHRRPSKERISNSYRNTRSVPSSASRRDFFAFLDAQVGPETPVNMKEEDLGTRHFDGDDGTPYYRPGEMVTNNDLSKEFKAYLDGKYTLKKIRDHVARCIVGFLNSAQKGMLLVGVDSNGLVVGIDCDPQQEDRFRRHFLDAVKEIYPPVFGDDYSIHFAPLLEDNGRQHSSLKVIEVRVFPPENADNLYECKEGVFVRRNGVLTGPIKPSHIQEWVKQRHFEELRSMQQSEAFLKEEMDRKDQMLRRQADTIAAQRSEIEQQKQAMQNARSCTIL